ncbi:hypothetical protein M153_1547000595 [Pseudoloma neurophilia]|uniref:Uncharacterized protein n=1 Tax=Pseudoloma neurophilia TaxID=146866 RepID=A0A0R0LUL6_9MICR|nr:hypothetical protein M153_1547000595 [Pseudoloma neurophilia]
MLPFVNKKVFDNVNIYNCQELIPPLFMMTSFPRHHNNRSARGLTPSDNKFWKCSNLLLCYHW